MNEIPKFPSEKKISYFIPCMTSLYKHRHNRNIIDRPSMRSKFSF